MLNVVITKHMNMNEDEKFIRIPSITLSIQRPLKVYVRYYVNFLKQKFHSLHIESKVYSLDSPNVFPTIILNKTFISFSLISDNRSFGRYVPIFSGRYEIEREMVTTRSACLANKRNIGSPFAAGAFGGKLAGTPLHVPA